MDGTTDVAAERTGKITPAQFGTWIAPHLGAARPEVLLGPRAGTDCGIVRIGAGRVLAMTSDPISLIPGLGPERSAWLSCHLLASDLWTCGIPPSYAAVSFALPPSLSDDLFAAYARAMSEAWTALEIAVVTGHTGRYEGCDLTIVGAATLTGVGDEGRWIGAPFVEAGDRVLLTKGCAIEATALTAHLFPKRLAQRLNDEEALERAQLRIDDVSVVRDCKAALRTGVRERGVTLLHDATEGGVFGGLLEVARATGHDLRIQHDKIPVAAETRAVCELLGVDPYWTLSEGTLIATVKPEHVAAAMESFALDGIAAAEIGEVVRGSGHLWVTEDDQRTVTRIEAPLPDPWWEAYSRAVSEGWS